MTKMQTQVSLQELENRPGNGTINIPKYDRNHAKQNETWAFLSVGGLATSLILPTFDNYNAAVAGNPSKGSPIGVVGIGMIAKFDAPLKSALDKADNLRLLVERDGNGSKARLVKALTSYHLLPEDPAAAFQRLSDPKITSIAMTVTEAGYHINEATRKLNIEKPEIARDIELVRNKDYLSTPETVFGVLGLVLQSRLEKQAGGLNLVSCDNIRMNGKVLEGALADFLAKVSPELAQFAERGCRFPNTMVDKITPKTTPEDEAEIRSQYSLKVDWPVVAEPFSQWGIEKNKFLSGTCPDLGLGGADMVDDVETLEYMKLMLLNCVNTCQVHAMAVAGYRMAAEGFQQPFIRNLVDRLWKEELIPYLLDRPHALTAEQYSRYTEQLAERFGNVALKDQVLRICEMSSAKVAERIVPSALANLAAGRPVTMLAVAAAAYTRSLLEVDERGESYEIKDKNLPELKPLAQAAMKDPQSFLDNATIIFPSELAQNPKFSGVYVEALNMIATRGIVATYQHYADQRI